MNNPVTILTRLNTSELYVPMSLLQSRNIACEVKNGIANQVTPMYTIGDGGAKLQVNHEDFEIAFNILKEGGFISDEPITESSFIDLFDQLSSRIPILGASSLFLRFAMFILIVILLFVALMYPAMT